MTKPTHRALRAAFVVTYGDRVLLVRTSAGYRTVPARRLHAGESPLAAPWPAFAETEFAALRPALLGLHEDVPWGQEHFQRLPHALTFALHYHMPVREQPPLSPALPDWDATWTPLAEAAPVLQRDLGPVAASLLLDPALPRPALTGDPIGGSATDGSATEAGERTRVNVRVAACDADGRLLLLRRGDGERFWVPGRSLQRDETLRDCAARAVREETGLSMPVGPLLAVDAHHVFSAAATGAVRTLVAQALFLAFAPDGLPAAFMSLDTKEPEREVHLVAAAGVAALPPLSPVLLSDWGRVIAAVPPDTYTLSVAGEA